jgi:hypothetical protein
MLFSLITKVGGSEESGVGKGEWRGRGANGFRVDCWLISIIKILFIVIFAVSYIF